MCIGFSNSPGPRAQGGEAGNRGAGSARVRDCVKVQVVSRYARKSYVLSCVFCSVCKGVGVYF